MKSLAWLLLASAGCGAAANNSDELSLLQQHTRAFDRKNDTIYHLHIPKCAGISFAEDVLHVLRRSGCTGDASGSSTCTSSAHGEGWPSGVKIASREGCLAWGKHNERIWGTTVMLRDPRRQVLSEFDFCWKQPMKSYIDVVRPKGEPGLPERFEDWVRGWVHLKRQGWHGNFTPSAALVSKSLIEATTRLARIRAWSSPPFSPEKHNLDLKNWPQLDGGGTVWHFVHVPYQCYAPISLQAQRLTCEENPLDYGTMPSGELAISNMESVWFVGIVEAYQASLCLFQAKLGHALPPYCNCRKPVLWKSADFQEANGVDHENQIEDLPEAVLKLVDELTVADRQLYKAARARFLRDIGEVEKEHGIQIVCEELRQQLEA